MKVILKATMKKNLIAILIKRVLEQLHDQPFYVR